MATLKNAEVLENLRTQLTDLSIEHFKRLV